MINVNNKKTICRLSASSFHANKMRNIFAVIAIVLTTVLFTGLFTVTSSLLASMEESTMRQIGGRAHGGFKYITQEQYDKLKTHPSIEEIFYTVVLGIAENKELAKRPTEIRFVTDEVGAMNMFGLPTTGRLPQNDDEIATDTIVLNYLGVPVQLGQKITLEYTLDGKKCADTFTLVGYWQGDKLMSASQAWLGRGYVEKKLEGYVPKEDGTIGTINADVNFSNSFNIEKKLLKILTDSGYSMGDIKIGVNWAYTGNSDSYDIGTILGGVGAVFMIVFCGYLMISNVFYISVAKDIRFFGLLKTVGTTGKQIRFLIRRQALRLCAVGIFIGLLAGYFVGAWITPTVLTLVSTNVIKVSANPIAFLAAALFAMITVFISIAKPSKMAARVSPIEALRSTDGEMKSRKASKKSKGINLWNLAQGNVFRNKKKLVFVTISLSLSLIILNFAYSLANSFDMDKYLSNMIGSDFAAGDVSNFNVHIYYADQDTLNPGFLEELSSRKGLETISNIYFAEPLTPFDPRLEDLPERVKKDLEEDNNWIMYMKQEMQSGKVLQHIYGMDENIMDLLTVFSGKIDVEKLRTGDYVISVPYDSEGKVNLYNVGDKVNITNLEGVSKEYEVLAVASIPYNITNQHRHPIMPEFIMTSDIFLQDIAQKDPMLTTFNVEDGYEAEMESFIEDYCETIDSDMQYRSKASLAQEYEDTQRTYKSIGLILSLLVAFIGIMNFINTVVTSIISRKRELAMLQSIGMTDKQTQNMLICEGLVYTALTAIFALTVGSVLGILGVRALTIDGMYYTLQFTVLPSLVCLPVLVIISILVPFVSEKVIHNDSVVERLREVE